MRARDIMERIKDWLTPEDTLKDAINKMRVCKRGEHIGVRGMVVLDENKKLIGTLSMEDILRAVIPSYMSVAELGEFTWDGMLEQMALKYSDKKVGDFMAKNVITVPEKAPLMECADFMLNYNLQRIPVVDNEKNIVGMVYIRDLYYSIVKVLFDDKDICAI